MKSLLERRLDFILEDDTTQMADDPYQAAMNVVIDLEEARRKVTDLERQLMYAMDRLCGGLAVGIRKHQPGLNVGLDNGNCKIGYRTKHLILKPDLTKKVWAVSGPDQRFARRFMKDHAPHTNLTSDTSMIAQAIANFFTKHYRTLGEEISGYGILLLDGHKIKTLDLISYVRNCDRILLENNRNN